MTTGYQPFLISELKTGISTYQQPWMRPADSFDPLINAYVNRGVLNKRNGSSAFGNTLKVTAISNAASAVITSSNTFAAGDYGSTLVTFFEVQGMTQINGLTGTVQSSTPTSFVVNINTTAFASYTAGTLSIAVMPLGKSTQNPVMGIMRYINEAAGSNQLLAATTTHLYLYSGSGSYSDITPASGVFTGKINNFFNYTNWQPVVGSASSIYMTNNKDPVTTWSGTGVAIRPTIPIDSTGTPETISTCLDVKVYKQRLLFIRTTLKTSGAVENQTIRWSSINNGNATAGTINAKADVSGNGGYLAAPTGDIIQSAQFIRDVLVVFFTHSTWVFRYTGLDTQPFRWDKINDTRSTTAPYSSVPYDDICTAIGNTGFIACGGANVERYDLSIVDYYETKFSGSYYAQTFAQRYDNLNQTWMLYVSTNRDPVKFPVVGGVAPGSDSALIYNFQEKSFSTYTFSRPLTCLGTFYNQTDVTWADETQAWEDTDDAWDSYASHINNPILLAGDTTGHLWLMDDATAVTDAGVSIIPDITTTRWNPLMQGGQKTQFGWIDVYYYIASLDTTNPVQVTLKFYADNSSAVACSRTLTLDGPINSEYTFKRIFVNVIGEFLQMEIDPNVDSNMRFLGFVLWVKPAGRLTP